MSRVDHLGQIRLIICDVDGVLTDGKLMLGPDGQEIVCFHVHDGLGIRKWLDAGGSLVLLTGRRSKAVQVRAEELGVEVFTGVADKAEVAAEIMSQRRVLPHQVAYIGDDENDIPVMSVVGVAAAVANAVAAVRQIADIVLKTRGGEGAVREFIELALRAVGR